MMKLWPLKFWIGLFVLLWSASSFAPVHAAAFQVSVTAQQFEKGQMIFRSDTGDIWVFADDGRALRFASAVYSHLPDNPIFGTPPSRLRPIMGFGKVWGNNLSVRTALGWPTNPEMSFMMGVETAGANTYFTQFDGSVIEISPDNTWRYSTPRTGPWDMPPGINLFDVLPNPVSPSDTVTVNWEVRGVDLAIIEVYGEDDIAPVTLLTDLPVSGSTTVVMPEAETSARFVLWAANYPAFPSPVTLYERVANAELRVYTPPEPVSTYGAFQPYERGFMLWRQDTGDVLVFGGGNGSIFWVYSEGYYAALPDNPVPVPSDRYRPVNAFGKVWGDNQQVRDALGYPTGPEQGYTMVVENFLNSDITHRYSLPDNRSIAIEDGRFWYLR